jgi:membrane protease YdiL (CAAX protease family)
VLLCLRAIVSPAYTPSFFVLGIAFGLPAGLFEEIGWMGFAFPRMRWPNSAFGRAVWLGVVWSAWHSR